MKGTTRGSLDVNDDHRIAPCGLECARCIHFLAGENPNAMKQIQRWSAALNIPTEKMICGGCRAHAGRIPFQNHLFGDDHCCAVYECAERKKVGYCGFCDRFPCRHRHPYTEKAGLVSSGIKPFLGL